MGRVYYKIIKKLIKELKKNKDFNTWGSHLYLFEKFFDVTNVKNIIEFGCGYFSTEYLSYNCDKLISIETDEKYLNEISIKCRHRKNVMFFYEYPDKLDELLVKKPDLVFVDAKKEKRVPLAQWALDNNIEYIVLHDIEKPEVYHWDRLVIPEGYYIYDCKDVPKQTRLLTTNKEIIDKIKLFIIKR